MEQSLVYNVLKKIPYPFITRHNRALVYSENPSLDYINLWRNSLRCFFVGFLIGKFLRMPWTIALLGPIPLITKFLIDQYNMKKEGKYQQLYRFENWETKKKINQMQMQSQRMKTAKQKNIQIHSKVILQQQIAGQGITSIKEYVKRLPKEYFNF